MEPELGTAQPKLVYYYSHFIKHLLHLYSFKTNFLGIRFFFVFKSKRTYTDFYIHCFRPIGEDVLDMEKPIIAIATVQLVGQHIGNES